MPKTPEKPRQTAANASRFRNVYLRRVVVTALQILGPERAGAFAKWLGAGLFDFALRDRATAERHLDEAFGPSLAKERRDSLVRASFAYAARVWLDPPLASRKFAGRAWKNHVVCENGIDLIDRMRRPDGAILTTPHFGNIAVAACLLARATPRLAMIVDPNLDPTRTEWSADLDRRLPLVIMTPDRAAREAEPWLESGGKLLVVGDHFRATGRGPRVTYLGSERTFFPTLALWSCRCNAPIIVVTCRRHERGYHFSLAAHGEVSPQLDAADPVAEITAEYAAIMDAVVRRYPAQYYWIRRWNDEDSQPANTETAT